MLSDRANARYLITGTVIVTLDGIQENVEAAYARLLPEDKATVLKSIRRTFDQFTARLAGL